MTFICEKDLFCGDRSVCACQKFVALKEKKTENAKDKIIDNSENILEVTVHVER